MEVGFNLKENYDIETESYSHAVAPCHLGVIVSRMWPLPKNSNGRQRPSMILTAVRVKGASWSANAPFLNT